MLCKIDKRQVFLGLDPGKYKCGLALMGIDRKVWLQEIVPAKDTIGRIEEILAQYPLSLVVLGNGTGNKIWQEQLQRQIRVVVVDEKFSTLEARQRYWELYPPQGLIKLIPPKLRLPPRDLDDFVALILIERYLKQLIAQ